MTVQEAHERLRATYPGLTHWIQVKEVCCHDHQRLEIDIWVFTELSEIRAHSISVISLEAAVEAALPIGQNTDMQAIITEAEAAMAHPAAEVPG